jgi:tRNA (adenine22-N1)-methyltransferase
VIKLKLSSRLQTIADLIDDNSRVYDIGCDHAHLDIYLTLYRHNIKCIATDINPKVLEYANLNIRKYNLENNIEVIKSNGLDNLDVIPTDVIVISGLGTSTITKIVENNIRKLPNTMIIQTNNDVVRIRKKIVQLGYYIEQEKFIYEKKKIYVIIRFIKGISNYKNIDYLLGPILKDDKKFLQKNIDKHKAILSNLPNKYWLKRLKIMYIVYKLKKRL